MQKQLSMAGQSISTSFEIAPGQSDTVSTERFLDESGESWLKRHAGEIERRKALSAK